jgi:hypothetical protein
LTTDRDRICPPQLETQVQARQAVTIVTSLYQLGKTGNAGRRPNAASMGFLRSIRDVPALGILMRL